MALAETAHLLAQLDLKDNLSGPAKRAEGAIAGLERASAPLPRRFGGLSGAAGKFGGALSHAKGAIGGLLSGPLGLLGLGAGLFSVEHLFSESIGEARDFGREVALLGRVTGLDVEQTSALAGAFHHFGIEADTAQRLAGFAEKNLQNYGGTAKKAAVFQKQYGLALVDSSGRIKDFNTLLLDSADFFNSNASASQKAAGLAKIYGRAWQELIPILSAGRAGIAGAEEEARQLGLTLTGANVRDLAKLRDSTREWGTALAGLKLQIGLAAVPALTDLTKAATGFLRNGGREQIVDFFKQLIGFGRQAGDVIQNQVIPTFRGIYGAWLAVPKELRDLIVTGLVANKTVKFLFGFSPLDLGKDLLGGLIGGLGKSLFQRGGSPATPLFVADVAGGLGGAAGAAEAGAVGTLGKVTNLVSKVFVVGLAAEVASVLSPAISQAGADIHHALGLPDIKLDDLQWPFGPKNTPTILPNVFGGNGLLGGTAPTPPSGVSSQTGGERAADARAATANSYYAAIEHGITAGNRDLDKLNGTVVGSGSKVRAGLDALHVDFAKQRSILQKSVDPKAIARAAAGATKDILKGVGNVGNTADIVTELKRQRRAAVKRGDRQLVKLLDSDIEKVGSRLAARQRISSQLRLASEIAAETRKQTTPLRQLRTDMSRLKDIQAGFVRRGDTHAAQIVGQAIKAMKERLAATTNNTTNVLRHKKLEVTNNISIPVKTVVNVRDSIHTQTTYKRYHNVLI